MTHYAHPEQVLAAIESVAGQTGETVFRRKAGVEASARASESGV
jgi:hypothetical protein